MKCLDRTKRLKIPIIFTDTLRPQQEGFRREHGCGPASILNPQNKPKAVPLRQGMDDGEKQRVLKERETSPHVLFL